MNLDRLTIILPWPDPMLFPNARRGSFRKFQPFIEAARDIGYYAAKEALGRNEIQISGRTPVSLLFAMPHKRNRDWDGMAGSIKHHMDGTGKALGVDDKVFRPVVIDDCLDAQKQGFVKVEIGI